MTEGRVNYRDLLEFVENVVFGNVDPNPQELIQRLQPYRGVFLNLLAYPGPSPDSREQVVGGNPATASGHVSLGAKDIQDVLLLSDELRVDEILALQCLLAAHVERGEVAAEVAAGIFFDERRAALASLHLLLQVQAVGGEEGLNEQVFEAISTFNKSLLVEPQSGGLLPRLITCIQDTSLEGGSGSKLSKVVDERGSEVDRRALIQAERSILCECLVYCCVIERRQPPANILSMMTLLGTLASGTHTKAQGPGGEAAHQVALQQAYTVLLAIVYCLLPYPSDDRVDNALSALATNAELVGQFAGEQAPEDGFQAVLRLTWGTLLSNQGPPTSRERSALCVKQACDFGVLSWIREHVIGSTSFQDELPYQQELYAQILGQLLLDFVYSDVGRDAVGALMVRSTQMVVGGGENGGPGKADDLSSLLWAIADVFRVYPAMFVNEDLRDPVLGVFMEYIARSTLLSEVPAVFVAYLEVLRSLAHGPKGAQSMFEQLRPGNTYAIISWNSMFLVIKQYCLRFLPERDSVGRAIQQGRTDHLLLPPEDVQAMCAYLRLFANIFSEGGAGDVVAWRHTLEEETGVGSPLWEVLFQLMAHPVPQELKAALDGAIGACARSPETAVQLLERLLQAVVVSPLAPTASVLPRYDLAYQLNEIEARKEEYDETLAFVRMLNQLYKTAGTSFPDEGRAYLHFTAFVRTDVLGVLHQRAFKSQKQKWELASACFEHLQVALKTLKRPLPPLPVGPEVSIGFTPGMLVMMDLLGERAGLRAALGLVLAGVETALRERREEPWGAAREDALLAALRLIRIAFTYDLDVVAALRKSVHTGQYEPLDVVMRAEVRRIPSLMQYVAYVDNPALQAEAIRISSALASRLPNLPALLLQAPSSGQVPSYLEISAGFGICLWESLFTQTTFVPLLDEEEEENWEGEEEGEDIRGNLILQLLLQCCDYPAPNLTHMLLGFNVLEGPHGVAATELDARAPTSCLAALMKAAQSGQLPSSKPQLYEQVLGLLHVLAAAPLSMEPTLSLLRSSNLLLNQLENIACCPLFDDGKSRSAQLYQKAALLQLGALGLLRSDPALPNHREYCLSLLSALFLPIQETMSGQEGDMEEGQRGARMAEILSTLAYPLAEPQLSNEVGPEVRRLQQRMGLDVLLASPVPVEEGGIRTFSAHGVPCYDITALAKVLRTRYAGQEQDSRRYPGGPAAAANQELREACQSVLRFAIKYNAAAQEAGAQLDALRGWQALCEIAFALRYDLLEIAAGALGLGAAAILQEVLEDVLEALLALLPAEGPRLAPSLSEVVRTLMMRLQEQASHQMGLPSDPGPPLRVPARCHEVLLKLVAALREGRSAEAVRLPLYGAVLHYLQLCRPPPAARVPPAVLEALLQGMGVGVEEGSAHLSQVEVELEAGNAAILSSFPQLNDLLATDALSPSSGKVGRTLALSVLSALLASSSGVAIAEGLNRNGVAGALLQDLLESAHVLLLQVAGKAKAALTLQEAQLSLLLRIVWSGLRGEQEPPSSRLSAVNTISTLARCRAMDLEPEEAGSQSDHHSKLRACLARFNAAVLRIVNAILSALPGSSGVRAAAAEFAGQHQRALLRILREAAAPPMARWEPGEVEWEQASLVVDLLRRSFPEDSVDEPTFGPLHDAVLGLVRRHASTERRGELMLLDAGPTPPGPEISAEDPIWKSSLPVWELKAALSLYLCNLVCYRKGGGLLLPTEAPQTGSAWHPSLITIRDLLSLGAEHLLTLQDYKRRLVSDLRNQSYPMSDTRMEMRWGLQERGRLARRAGSLQREEETVLVLIESCLMMLSFSLKKSPSSTSKPAELASLRRPLLPILDQLEGLDNLTTSRDMSSLEVLVRRVKDVLSF